MNNTKKNSILQLAILSIAIVGLIAGCTAEGQLQKSWQRVAAEKVYAGLDSERDDMRRTEIRDYVKALISLDRGGDPDKRFSNGRTLLMMAVIRGDKKIVEHMLSLDVYADVDCADDKGDTPLIVASRNGHVEIASMLVKAGAGINKQNNEGTTALMVCAETGNKAIAKPLMEAGADRYLKDKEGRLFGNYATSGGHSEMTSFILDFKFK